MLRYRSQLKGATSPVWEEYSSQHPAIRTVWRAHVEIPGEYRLPANEFWGVSFVRAVNGTIAAEIDGPTLQASVTKSVQGEQYWGLELEAHVFVRDVTKASLGLTYRLPVHDGYVLIGEHRAAVPCWDQLEDFVDHLIATGVLIVDSDVRRALDGDYSGLAQRTWQRRFRTVTGLSPKQVQQLHRARHAYVLLQSGRSPAEAAAQAGFADQSHLTRSLRRMQDDTPARIIAAHLRRSEHVGAFVQDLL